MSEPTAWECPYFCGADFATKEEAQAHVQAHHMTQTCPFCHAEIPWGHHAYREHCLANHGDGKTF